MMKKAALRLLYFFLAFVGILIINFFAFSWWTTRDSEGERISVKANGQSALLVVDIQEGTTGSVSVDESFIEQADSLIARVNRLTAEAVKEGRPVIYIGSEVRNPLVNVLNSTLAKDSEGAGMDKRLKIRSDYIVIKHRSDAFHEEELNQLLNSLGVTELELVGLDALHCVLSTTRGALQRGYKVTVVEDAVIAKTEASKLEALQAYRALDVNIK